MNNTSLHEQATRGIEAISTMVAERDHFRVRSEKLEVSAALMTQEIESLKQRLALCTAERDHYMRHSVELTSRLNNIQIVINETIREARDGAFRPSPVPRPNTVSTGDVAALESLIARLPENGGEPTS
jgi:hypothetical protein